MPRTIFKQNISQKDLDCGYNMGL